MENSKKIIFVVENNKLERNLIRDYFKSNGRYQFEYFLSSASCIDALHKHPMAVLIDYDLNTIDPSEKDGIKILKQIKSLEHKTEVVFFSAHENTEIAVETIKNGAFDYIVLNENQFLRLENELKQIEDYVFHQTESAKYKTLFWCSLIVSIIFVFAVILLVALGILKPGNGSWVEH